MGYHQPWYVVTPLIETEGACDDFGLVGPGRIKEVEGTKGIYTNSEL